MEPKEHFHDLVIKSLQGHISDSEKEKLTQLLQDSNKQHEYDALSKLWDKAPHNYFLTADMKSKDWLAVKAQIKPNTINPRWYLSAASIVVLFIVSYSVWFSQPFQDDPVTYQTSEEIGTFILPDSSEVILNRYSSLILSGGFNQTSRESELIGEAFFQVKRNEKKPFIINAGKTTTKVLGTSFNIWHSKQQTNVDVSSGKVSFSAFRKKEVLTKGQSAKFMSDDKSMRLFHQTSNVHSWRTGKLVFNNTPLSSSLEDISRHFNIKIDTNSLDLSEIAITTSFDQPNLKQVISELSLMLNVEIVKSDDVYFIKPQQ